MRRSFVETSNVNRFLAGIDTVENRGAREAGMLLLTGEAGYGKTRTARWWAVGQEAVYIRAKAPMTPHWLLKDLVRELGHATENSCEALFSQAVESLIRNPRPIVVDEADHLLHDGRVIEALRDISDLVENTVVLVGMEHVKDRIAQRRQISTRIASVVTFGPATVADVRLCCDQLCEVPLADDLVAEIHRQAAGRLREVVNAIGVVERTGKRGRGATVALSDMAGTELVHDWQAGRPRRARAA